MRRIAALGAALVLLLAAAPVASADSGKANPGKSDEARAEHQATTKFWTKERVRQAKPRDFVRVRGTDRFVPAKSDNGRGKPPKDDGGGDSNTTTDETGAPWEDVGSDATDSVSDVTGKVLFELDGSLWVCSATAVKDDMPDRTLILTAAHCVYDNEIGEFATMWMFIPDYDSDPVSDSDSEDYYTAPDLTGGSFCAKTKHGCWTSSALVLHDGFSVAGGFNTQAVLHDFAFAVVTMGGKSEDGTLGLLEDRVIATYPNLLFDDVRKGSNVSAFGYPHALPYDGTQLIYSSGDVGFDKRLSNLTYKLGSDMTGGASGGGWFSPFVPVTGKGTLMSVNSYGRTGGKAMYGPKFDDRTRAVFEAAQTADVNE